MIFLDNFMDIVYNLRYNLFPMIEEQPVSITKKPSISLTPTQLKSMKSPRSMLIPIVLPPSQTFTPSHTIISPHSSCISTPEYHKQHIQQFKEYSGNIDAIIQKVNSNQLEELRNKYRYYLNKVEKLQRNKDMLQDKQKRLEEIVESSATIREQIDSINFILMISKDTENKLVKVAEKVNHAKDSKKKYKKQIEELLRVIKKQKDEYFSLKRKEMLIKNTQQSQLNNLKLQYANTTFKNIINEKINKKREIVGTMKEFNMTTKTINSNANWKNYKTTANSNKDKDKEISKFSSFQVIKKEQGKHELPQLVKKTSNLSQNQTENFKLEQRESQIVSTYENKCDESKALKEECPQAKVTSNIKFHKNEGQSDRIDKPTITNKKSKKSQQIVTQLHRIHLMKQQLLKQTEKISPNPILTQPSNLKSTRKPQHKHYASGLPLAKDCPGCEHRSEEQRMWNQKYSLHAQSEDKPNTHPNTKDNDNSFAGLLMGNRTLQNIEDINKQRQAFLQLQPEEIVKKIVESGKIQQILKLMEKEQVYVAKNKIELKLLR